MSELIDLNQKKNTRKSSKDKPENAKPGEGNPKKKGEKKFPFAIIETDLAKFIDGVALPRLGSRAPLPAKFITYRPDKRKAPVILEVKPNDVVEIVDIEYMGTHLKRYVELLFDKKAKVYNIPHELCDKVIKSWAKKYQEPLVEMPIPVGFKSTKGYCFHRHDFDPFPVSEELLKEKASTFYDMKQRMTNSLAVVKRFGSVFDKNASRKQAVWIYGPPNGGKSQIPILLTLMVGGPDFVLPMELGDKDERSEYLRADLAGKRIAFVDEATPKLINNDFKKFTGSRIMTGRHPHGKSFSFEMLALFYYFSNNAPIIPNDDSLKIRLIVSRLLSLHEATPRLSEQELTQRFKEELPYIISYCWNHYLTTQHSVLIPADTEDLEESIEEGESVYHDFIDHFLVPDPNGEVPNMLLQKLLDLYFKDRGDQKKCRAIIKERFKTKVKRGGSTKDRQPRSTVGIRVKATTLPNFTFVHERPIEVKLPPIDPAKVNWND